MSPTNLQGLNLIRPPQPTGPYLADSQDPQTLLDLSHFPELSAGLDLWTNVDFESDEPLVHLNGKRLGGVETTPSTHSVEYDEEDDPDDGQPAQPDNHDNVVMADPVPVPPAQPHTASRPLGAFDLSSFLAGFGIDPFMVPPMQSASSAPSLAQILSLYPHATYPPPPAPASTEPSSHLAAAKRPRVRRSSVAAGANDHTSDNDIGSPEPVPDIGTPLTAAEDKRRRNTAASARFRLKKKEREAALEKKSKELEIRVTELERECEGLRRENGWLKGLVVGVTGVGATQQQPAPPVTAGVKRPREQVDSGGK